MRPMIVGLLAAALPLAAAAGPQQTTGEPHDFFRQHAGLSEAEIASVVQGRPVAKILSGEDRSEIVIFAAVYVDSTPDRYIARATDIDALRQLPGYVGAGRLSTPPSLSDLRGLELGPEDVDDLKKCGPGDCAVQLPASSMEEFRKAVDWSSPGAADQVNTLARQMALDAVLAYQRGGNSALGTYRDKKNPVNVGEQFERIVKGFASLPVYFPAFERYLLDYPTSLLPQTRNDFYWEKVDFGLKPTFRIVHAITHHEAGGSNVSIVALKQVYASHYFETAIDLTVCVPDAGRPGFYLITIKASEQAGLTGLKGGIIRKVAVGRTRSSLEQGLAAMKQSLEAPRTP